MGRFEPEWQKVTDENLERWMRDIKVEPTEQFKEWSFQHAVRGLEQSRRKVHRRRIWQKWRGALAVTAVTAMAVVLIFQFLFVEEGVDLPRLAEQFPAEGESGEQPPSEEEPVEESPHDPGQEEEEKPTADRPVSTVFTLYPEGIEEQVVFQLLDLETIPFTTYIPSDWQAEKISASYLDEELTGVRITPEKYDYLMEILFFPKPFLRQHVEEYLLLHKLEESSWQWEGLTELPSWAVQGYKYQYFDDEFERVGRMFISKYNDDEGEQWFYIQYERYLEAEGQPVKVEVIFDQWLWQNGEPLARD